MLKPRLGRKPHLVTGTSLFKCHTLSASASCKRTWKHRAIDVHLTKGGGMKRESVHPRGHLGLGMGRWHLPHRHPCESTCSCDQPGGHPPAQGISWCIYTAHYSLQFQNKRHILHSSLNRIIQMKHHSHNRRPPSASTDGGHVPKWHIQSSNPGTRCRALRSVSLGGSERQGSGNTGWAAQAEGEGRSFVGHAAPLAAPAASQGQR